MIMLSFIALSTFAQTTYYVSPAGNDLARGLTYSTPFKTLTQALTVMKAGDIVYMEGGTYKMTSTINSNSYSNLNGSNANAYVNIWAYPGETPVLDFSALPRVTSTARGFDLYQNYWYLKGLTIINAGDNGIFIGGSYNIVENCQVGYNQDTGIQLGHVTLTLNTRLTASLKPSYNYIHNCDVYHNYDPPSSSNNNEGGQNADGIDAKAGQSDTISPGPGNVIRGCRVFDNSDDGFDCYLTTNRVVFDSCWAFHNGYNLWNDPTFQGNGNGFKLGGQEVPGHHLVTNCISFDNMVKGFDQNNNTGGLTIYNCTGFRNGTYNFSFPENFVTEGEDTFRNNISYLSGQGGVTGITINQSQIVNDHNSWTIPLSVTDADFVSLDTSLARVKRLSDGTLPATAFLRLASGSAAIDTGINVGIAYKGSAPDLGAFEYGSETTAEELILSPAVISSNKYVTLNWAVLNGATNNTGWLIQRAMVNINGGALTWDSVKFVNTTYDSTTDNSITEYGDYWYRLKQKNGDSTIQYSNAVETNLTPLPSGGDATFDCYPNPFNTYLVVRAYLPVTSNVSIWAYNIKGQLIGKIVDNQNCPRSNSYLRVAFNPPSSGLYIIKIIATDYDTGENVANFTQTVVKLP